MSYENFRKRGVRPKSRPKVREFEPKASSLTPEQVAARRQAIFARPSVRSTKDEKENFAPRAETSAPKREERRAPRGRETRGPSFRGPRDRAAPQTTERTERKSFDRKPFSRDEQSRPSFSRDRPSRDRDTRDRPFQERRESSTREPRERVPYTPWSEGSETRGERKPVERSERPKRPAFREERPRFANKREDRPSTDRKPYTPWSENKEERPSRSTDRFAEKRKPFGEKRFSSRDRVPKERTPYTPWSNKKDQSETTEKKPKKRSGKPREWTPGKRKPLYNEPKPADGRERVQKLIAQAGFCSRREAEKHIEQGKVQVNDEIIKLGDLARVTDKITVNGVKLEFPKQIYYMLHKPKDYVTTLKDIYGNKTVMELIAEDERIYPVGRLDKDTTGLLLMTNDGDFANKIMHPRYEIQKTYRAVLDKPFQTQDIEKAKKGIQLKEGTVKAKIRVIGSRLVEVQLHQGYNHVVKRVMKEMGYWVRELTRIKIGSLTLNIPIGAFRPLTTEEVKKLLDEAKPASTSKQPRA